MRILHVVSTLNISSGIANFIVNYYRYLAKEDVTFDFLLFYDAPNSFDEEVKKMGSNIYYIPRPTVRTVNKYAREVEKLFEEEGSKWDVVHIHEILVSKYVKKSAHKRNIPIIIHSHNTKFVVKDDSKGSFSKNVNYLIKRIRNVFLLSGINKGADRYLACSQAAGNALFNKKIVNNPDKFFVVRNAIDYAHYLEKPKPKESIRNTLKLGDKKIVLNVGRLNAQKNQLFLVDVFKVLCQKTDDYVLVFAGDGELKQKLLEKSKEYGLEDKVFILGNRSDVNTIMSESDIFVFPSLFEGLGIVAVEAQASGLSCVCSDTVPEDILISDSVVFKSLNDSPESWATCIMSLECNKQKTIASLKNDYDVSLNAAKLLEIYQSLIK